MEVKTGSAALWYEARAALEAEKAAKAMAGDLYFIRAADAVKIGRTVNIVNRLGKMQADNHERLDCFALLRGKGFQERAWQKDFGADHIRGEWFKWTPRLEQAIIEARDALYTEDVAPSPTYHHERNL